MKKLLIAMLLVGSVSTAQAYQEPINYSDYMRTPGPSVADVYVEQQRDKRREAILQRQFDRRMKFEREMMEMRREALRFEQELREARSVKNNTPKIVD